MISFLDYRMQALDSFIAHVPNFEGDLLILAIPLSARPFNSRTTEDPTIGTSADTLRTRAGKCKASTTPTPQRKAKKSVGKSLGGIKINEPSPRMSASTPPSGSWKGIPIFHSKRYIRF
jgi:hypothetical protein